MSGSERQAGRKTDLDEKDRCADAMAELAALQTQHGTSIHPRGLCLREVEAADLHALHRMRMDPEVMRYMAEVETEPVAEKCLGSINMMILLMKEGLLSYTVDRQPADDEEDDGRDGDTIGFVGITSPPQVSFFFEREAWGKGYASVALKTFMDSYWQSYPRGLPLRKTVPQSYTESEESEFSDQSDEYEEGGRAGNVLEAHVREGNLTAERVLRKCRFVVARKEFMSVHGRLDVPVTVFRMRGRKQSDRPWHPISREQRWDQVAACKVDGELVWK